MRRTGHLFDRVVDRENLRVAVGKALRGKRSKADARAFVSDLDANLDEVGGLLMRGEFPFGSYHQFTIHDPKERLITAPCFRERVVHHAIMNVCEPVFERRLIADSFACRVGLGRPAALRRGMEFSRRFGFFLKLDIRKYFDSISRPILADRLGRIFKDRRLLDLSGRIIAGYEFSPDRGLPIGALTSQHFANFYLGWYDRFVKERLWVRGYVRYMDDCVLWSDSSAALREHLGATREFLATELDLTLKPEPYINRTAHGVDFLGARVFPNRVVLNRRSRTRFRRRLAALERAAAAGSIHEDDLQRRATALLAFTRQAGIKSWRFRRRVIESDSVSGHWPRTG